MGNCYAGAYTTILPKFCVERHCNTSKIKTQEFRWNSCVFAFYALIPINTKIHLTPVVMPTPIKENDE